MKVLLELSKSTLKSWCQQGKRWGDFFCCSYDMNEAVYGATSIYCPIVPCTTQAWSDVFDVLPPSSMFATGSQITLEETLYAESGFIGDVKVLVRFFDAGNNVITDASGNSLFGVERHFYDGGTARYVVRYLLSGADLKLYINDYEALSTTLSKQPAKARIYVEISYISERNYAYGGIRYLRVDYSDPIAEVMDLVMLLMPIIMIGMFLVMFLRVFMF